MHFSIPETSEERDVKGNAFKVRFQGSKLFGRTLRNSLVHTFWFIRDSVKICLEVSQLNVAKCF